MGATVLFLAAPLLALVTAGFMMHPSAGIIYILTMALGVWIGPWVSGCAASFSGGITDDASAREWFHLLMVLTAYCLLYQVVHEGMLEPRYEKSPPVIDSTPLQRRIMRILAALAGLAMGHLVYMKHGPAAATTAAATIIIEAATSK